HEENVTHAPVTERNVGFVFQHYALFRHLSVFENVAFALRVRGVPRARVRERVRELLRLVQLEGLERSLPSQRAGGQPQRIPFVMEFLGNVNVCHGSVQNGRARLGNLGVAYPDYPHDESRAATAFIRSHELEIVRARNGRPSLEARVTHVNPARPVVKVRVYSEAFGVVLTVDVSWERYAELRLTVGDTVWVSPRQLRVF